jgi:phosphoenolpyruvate carboxykinase (ATP)
VASTVPGIDDPELLQPRKLYERQGRMDEYNAFVDRFKRERVDELGKYTLLSEEIVRAVS